MRRFSAASRGEGGACLSRHDPGVLPVLAVLAEATQLAHSACPGIWRRHLTLILDGLRPGREGVTPLPVAALLPEEMEKGMRQAAPRHR